MNKNQRMNRMGVLLMIWAAACGRCGGIVAPLVVGALFTGPDQFALIFGIFTGVLVIISLTLWFLGVETMNKELDYI